MDVIDLVSDSDIRLVCEHTRCVARAAHVLGDVSFFQARSEHLACLVRECFREALGGVRIGSDEIQSRVGVSIPFLNRVEGRDDEVQLPRVTSWDPVLVGWAFQVWKELERERSAWGISYAAKDSAERAELAALTQIFTDAYIADFLIRATIPVAQSEECRPLRVCDPGCGAGHLLIRALRVAAARRERYGVEVYGFDIDPEAVELCRVLLLVEHLRLGRADDLKRIWKDLIERIVPLEAPLGILDRNVTFPVSSFDVVVANPPYLGRRKMPTVLRDFLDVAYPVSKIDLCAAFLERCVELLADDGALAFVASDKWLRLRSYRGFRGGNGSYRGFLREVSLAEIVELGARAFSAQSKMHDGVRVAVVSGRKRPASHSHTLLYRDLSGSGGYEDKVTALSFPFKEMPPQKILEQRTLITSTTASPFLRVSELPRELLESDRTVSNAATVVVGLQTNDDRRFVRYIWEVPPDRSRWRVHSKGGGYSRWCGLNYWILDWELGKQEFFKTNETREKAESWISKAGWCYGWFANGCLGLRLKESGWTFGRAATSGVFCEEPWLVAFLNSRWTSICVRHIGGKMQIPEGVVRQIPIPRVSENISAQLVELAVELKRRLITLDPADALFRPNSLTGWQEEYVLQTLLLLVEGTLEAQVEQALGVSQSESVRLAGCYGVPVSWLSAPSREAEDEFWSSVPAEFTSLREILKVERLRAVGSASVSREIPESEVRDALRKKNTLDAAPWPLPCTSSVEKLSRRWQAHPIEIMRILRGAERVSQGVRDSLHEGALYREVLSLLLDRLEHRWWNWFGAVARTPGASLSLDEAAKIMCEKLASVSLWDRGESAAKEWLCGPFSAWHKMYFRKRSPLYERQVGVREVVYSHRWDDASCLE